MDPSSSSQTVTIVTYNCNGIASGLGANVKFTDERTLGAFFRARLQADFICLQEHKLASAKLPQSRDLAVVKGYESFWSAGDKGYAGVVTYCASPSWSPVAAQTSLFGDDGGADPLDGEGRCVEVDLGSFVLINVYVPNAGGGNHRPAALDNAAGAGGGGGGGDEDEDEDRGAADPDARAAAPAGRKRLGEKLRFVRRLTARARELHAAGRHVVVVGDLNLAADDADVSPLIGPVASVYGAEERAALAELLAELPDAWRRLHPLPAGAEGAATTGDEGERGEARAKKDDEEGERAAAAAAAAAGPRPPKTPPPSVFTVWDDRTSARAFDRGLRIDYVLVSPRLLPLVVSAEILGKDALPQKWSDHAAVRVVLRRRPAVEAEAEGEGEAEGQEGAQEDVLAPPAPHAPCALSSLVDERWALRPKGQKSIASFFAPKRPAAAATGAGAGAGAGVAAGAAAGAAGAAGEGGNGNAREAPALKRSRTAGA